jgi:alcohol dehydrogenase YqhD (iron-dependent ADH family)
MKNFIFNAPTRMMFGKGQIERLPEVLRGYGNNVLLTYGGSSIKKNGIYDKIIRLLKDFNVTELLGIEPNPRITSVRKGVELCKKNKIDVVLAAGGGSTIDCSKIISAGAFYAGDAWDLVLDSSKVRRALPLVTVLTIAATGSEMNGGAVITNPETNEKLGTSSPLTLPRVSVCDPEYTYSLPALQTAAGTVDIMSHVFENYFKREEGAYVQDRFAEGILKTCIRYAPIALKSPTDYEARANLMWAGSMALNGLTGSGKPGPWSCHPIEHELSAFYDITHGVGLAILTPRWMRHILNPRTAEKFAEYAVNVWGLDANDDIMKLAGEAIDRTEQFFSSCGLPMSLSELGIDSSKFRTMAENAVRVGKLAEAYVPLTADDVEKILEMCL